MLPQKMWYKGSLAKLEVTANFDALKQTELWSRIPILSFRVPCTVNIALLTIIVKSCKAWFLAIINKTIHTIYQIKEHIELSHWILILTLGNILIEESHSDVYHCQSRTPSTTKLGKLYAKLKKMKRPGDSYSDWSKMSWNGTRIASWRRWRRQALSATNCWPAVYQGLSS